MFSRAFSQIGLLLMVLVAALMTACGGGGGSMSTPFEIHLSESRIAYGPITATIYGGRPPFYFETNSSGVYMPEKSDSRTVEGFVYPASEDGTGMISVWDDLHGHEGRRTATFSSPAAKFDPPALTVTATNNIGCTVGQGGNYTQICAGSPGIAELQIGGYNLVFGDDRVQFNVVQGDYQIRADGSSAWGTTTLTRVDSTGRAQVAIQTHPGVSTQIATINAKTEGLTLSAPFVIVGASFQMLPTSVSWTSETTTCPSRTASFSLYGGSPPYSVQTTLGTLSTSSVTTSGGSVTLTVAVCGKGELTARDTQGSIITAAINYDAASGDAPPPPPPPIVTSPLTPPGWGTSTVRVSCAAGSIFGFSVAGGTPPYTAYVLPMAADPVATVTGTVGQVKFTAAPAPNSNHTVYVVDSKGQASTTSPVIYCLP